MKPTAIITADNHILEKNPVCRMDDLRETQWKKQRWLRGLQQKYNCPILDGGDLFHHWKPSPELLARAINEVPRRIIVPGNHDLPAHNLDLYNKSGMRVLETAGINRTMFKEDMIGTSDFIIFSFPWGVELKPDTTEPFEGRKVALCHVFTYPGRKPWPGCKAPRAKGIMRKLKGFDLIITGDNHQPFTIEHDGQLLVNPGSLCRLTAGQAEHKPRVYLWYAENNTVEPVYVPIEKDIITRTHIESKEERDERMEAFVSRLDDDFEVGLSFDENLTEFMSTNDISKPVKRIINEAVYGE